MKNLLVAVLLTVALALGGCGMEQPVQPRSAAVPSNESQLPEFTTAPEKTDYMEIYRPVLDDLVELIDQGAGEEGPKDGQNGVWEAVQGLDRLRVATGTGYAMEDISGDGIPELLICEVSSREGLLSYGSSLLAVYTCRDNAPVLTLEGWARNRYYLLEDHTILNEGSAGAMHAIWGTYSLSEDGTELKCLDYFFTHEKEEDPAIIGFFHNVTGEWDIHLSEELEITEEQFWRLREDAREKTSDVSLIPFAEYGYDRFGSFVQAQWLDQVKEKPQEFTEFLVNEDDSQSKVLLTSFGTVRDFRLLSLTYRESEEDGRPQFDTEEVYALEVLAEDRPLVVGISFFGTIPNNGIRFVNDRGETKTYALEVSGMDGSLLLTEIG